MNARWYDPNLGRFINQDSYQGTLDNPLSQNLYSYVMNNPGNMWNPSGNVPCWVGNEWRDEITCYDEAKTEYKAQFWFLKIIPMGLDK